MEFTIAFPCTHLRPASITSHLDESSIIGMRAISGSDAIKFRKCCIALRESSIPSSILMSMTWAPFSTCCLATDTASSNCSSIINLAKALDPVTLVLSPTFINKVSSLMVKGSNPESLVNVSCMGIDLGFTSFI